MQVAYCSLFAVKNPYLDCFLRFPRLKKKRNGQTDGWKDGRTDGWMDRPSLRCVDASKNQGFILNLNALIMDTLIDVIASIRIERKIQVFYIEKQGFSPQCERFHSQLQPTGLIRLSYLPYLPHLPAHELLIMKGSEGSFPILKVCMEFQLS